MKDDARPQRALGPLVRAFLALGAPVADDDQGNRARQSAMAVLYDEARCLVRAMGLPPDRREDLPSECILKLVQHGSFEADSAPGTEGEARGYLRRTLHNLDVDGHRKQRKLVLVAEVPEGPAESSEGAFFVKDGRRALETFDDLVMSELDPAARRTAQGLARVCWLAERTIEELRSEYGIGRAAIDQRHRRLRVRLRERVRALGDEGVLDPEQVSVQMALIESLHPSSSPDPFSAERRRGAPRAGPGHPANARRFRGTT